MSDADTPRQEVQAPVPPRPEAEVEAAEDARRRRELRAAAAVEAGWLRMLRAA
jgi:hypothetical protein